MYGYVAYIRYKFRAKHERMPNNSLTNCAKRRDMGFFLVPLKVRFLAMTMFNQARRCSFGLTKTFVGTYPCHTNHIESDDVQAKELQTDMGQEERYLSPRPCRLPLTGVALIKMWLCG